MSSYLRDCRMDESRCIERPGRWCRFSTNVLLSYAIFMSYVYMHQCVVLYHICSSIFMSCVLTKLVLWRRNSLREAMRVARNGSSQAQLATYHNLANNSPPKLALWSLCQVSALLFNLNGGQLGFIFHWQLATSHWAVHLQCLDDFCPVNRELVATFSCI